MAKDLASWALGRWLDRVWAVKLERQQEEELKIAQETVSALENEVANLSAEKCNLRMLLGEQQAHNHVLHERLKEQESCKHDLMQELKEEQARSDMFAAEIQLLEAQRMSSQERNQTLVKCTMSHFQCLLSQENSTHTKRTV